MTRMAILVFSLVSLASLGVAAQHQNNKVNCSDGTYCPEGSFCSRPKNSDSTLCSEQWSFRAICDECGTEQICVWSDSKQGTCVTYVNSATDCPADEVFVLNWYDNSGACLSRSVPNGNGPMACGDGSTCDKGYYCFYKAEAGAQMLCAPQMDSGDLCQGCPAKIDVECYLGPQYGQLTCEGMDNCESLCDGDDEFCVKRDSDDDDGLCLKKSQPYAVASS